MISQKFIYAPNIHQGGGKALLLPLLKVLQGDDDTTFILDQRLQIPPTTALSGKVFRVKATILSRLKFEFHLRSLITPDVQLLCMGSLPPLFTKKGKQVVFVQNRYLVENVSLHTTPLAKRFQIEVERWWLRTRSLQVKYFIVQTPTMQKLINETLQIKAKILPFVANAKQEKESTTKTQNKQFDYLYVATGETHKNHKNLIKAWSILAKKELYPHLCLTLDAKLFPELCTWIKQEITTYGLKIAMVGECSHSDLKLLYKKSSALVYPSLFESFGLPLIEAVHAGLPILASDDSYVNDVIVPTAVFNPKSPQSMADTIETFKLNPATLNIELLDAQSFISKVFAK